MGAWNKPLIGKLGLLLLCAATAVLFYLIVAVVLPAEKPPLDTPKNLRLEGYTLKWSAVEFAVGYEIDIGGETRASNDNEMKLKYSDGGATARVRAMPAGDIRLPSEYCEETEIIFDEGLPLVIYSFDGYGELKTQFNYGENIDLSPADLSEFGYNFTGWYEYVGGEKQPISGELIREGDVLIFADAEPIVYNVRYAVSERGLPESYTVESVYTLYAQLSAGGYYVEGWYLDQELTRPLGEGVMGDITLYPKWRLLSEELIFAKTEGGVAVAGITADNEILHVPEYYGKDKVVKVERGAIEGKNLRSVVFYGDVFLETGSISNCPSLNALVFEKSVRAEEGAISAFAFDFEITVKGVPDLKAAFISYYLGISGKITLNVQPEYLPRMRELFSDFNVQPISNS